MKTSFLYTLLAATLCGYAASLRLTLPRGISSGTENMVLYTTGILLVFSLASLAALASPNVRSHIQGMKQRWLVAVSLAVIAAFTYIVISLWLYPPSDL